MNVHKLYLLELRHFTLEESSKIAYILNNNTAKTVGYFFFFSETYFIIKRSFKLHLRKNLKFTIDTLERNINETKTFS